MVIGTRLGDVVVVVSVVVMVMGMGGWCEGKGDGYVPVIAMHGFSYTNNAGTVNDYDEIKKWVEEAHPGQSFVSLDVNNGVESMRPMWGQVETVREAIKAVVRGEPELYAQGVHLLGHSQGALLLRCVLEVVEEGELPPIVSFVSMAGIQQGFYGTAGAEHFLPNVTEALMTEILYTKEAQDVFSLANWWHDPFDQDKEYLAKNIFLPAINNIQPGNVSATLKANFVRELTAFPNSGIHLFGSPNDGTVYPWISELFGFFAPNTLHALIDMEDTDVYKTDAFGLKTLDGQGRVWRTAVDGVEHAQWLHNQTNFERWVMPLLT